MRLEIQQRISGSNKILRNNRPLLTKYYNFKIKLSPYQINLRTLHKINYPTLLNTKTLQLIKIKHRTCNFTKI